MKTLQMLIFFTACLPVTSIAQQSVFTPENSGYLPLFLAEPTLLDELGLSERKSAEVAEIRREIRQTMQDYVRRSVRMFISSEEKNELKAQHQRNLTTIADQLCAVVGPEKWERLDQLFLRYQLGRQAKIQWFQGELRAVASNQISDLELTDRQRQNIEEVLDRQHDEWIKVTQRHRKEFAELSRSHEKEVLDLLSEGQQRTFQSLFGANANFILGRMFSPNKNMHRSLRE